MLTKDSRSRIEEQREFERELELYLEMRDNYHEEWYAIAGGRLYHAQDSAEVERQIRQDGLEPGSLGVHFMPHGPPYQV